PPSGVPNNETITVHLTQQDQMRGEGLPPFPIDRLQNELLRVGLNALKIAADRGLALGRPTAPTDTQLTEIDRAIEGIYQVERPPWPAHVNTTRGGGKYTVQVESLRFVARVDAEVVRGQIPGENGPTDFVGATEAGEKKLANILKTASERAHRFIEENDTGL